MVSRFTSKASRHHYLVFPITGEFIASVSLSLLRLDLSTAKLPVRKGSIFFHCTVTLQDWDIEQRRFIERLVEHLSS